MAVKKDKKRPFVCNFLFPLLSKKGTSEYLAAVN